MRRSRASDEAFSCLLIVNLISLAFVSNLSFNLFNVASHFISTIVYNALATLLWLVLYNGLLLHFPVSVSVTTYWNKLVPIIRIAVLLVLMALFCLHFTYRVLLVGLASSYFIERHKKITSRKTLVSTLDPVVNSSGDVSEEYIPFRDSSFHRQEDTPASGSASSTIAQRMPASSQRRSAPVAVATTPFGDKIVPPSSISGVVSSSSDSNGTRQRRGNRVSVIAEHQLSHISSASTPRAQYHDEDDGGWRREQEEQEKELVHSVQSLADGMPQEGSSRNTLQVHSESSKRKRKKSSGIEDEQPDMKKKNSCSRVPVPPPSSLWQQVYQGISAFVGAHSSKDNDNSSVKRKRDVESREEDVTRSMNAKTLKSAAVMTSPSAVAREGAGSKRSRHRVTESVINYSQLQRDEVTDDAAQSPDRQRRHKTRRSNEEGRGEATAGVVLMEEDQRPTYPEVEAITVPQSKYLQDLMKKKEAKETKESSSHRSALVVISGPAKAHNSARPSLHRRASSTVKYDLNVLLTLVCNVYL